MKGWLNNGDQIPRNIKNYVTLADEHRVYIDLTYKSCQVVVPTGACQEMQEHTHSSHIGINGCSRCALLTWNGS